MICLVDRVLDMPHRRPTFPLPLPPTAPTQHQHLSEHTHSLYIAAWLVTKAQFVPRSRCCEMDSSSPLLTKYQ